jgi:hypothetical protein
VNPEVLNLFVVRKLMDIHEPGRIRSGVHWKARRHVPGNLVGYIPGRVGPVEAPALDAREEESNFLMAGRTRA